MKKLALIATICILSALVFSTSYLVQASPSEAILRPDGGGDYAQWDVTGATYDYEATNDQSDTTDIYTNLVGEIDLMNIQNLPAGSGTIHSVTIWFRGQVFNKGGTPERAATYLKTNTNYFQGGNNTMVAEPSWGDYSEVYTTNPQTLSAWTWDEVDALQAGVVTVTQDSDEPIHVSEVWVVVDYTTWSTWNSYLSDYSTSCEDYNTGTSDTIYMKGTGFETGNYIVRYYDALEVQVGSDASIYVEAPADLQSNMLCNTNPLAAEGTWHARVYRLSDDALIADDSFYVNADVIPEFPTVMADIGVAGLCFGIYYWMRKRRLPYVKA